MKSFRISPSFQNKQDVVLHLPGKKSGGITILQDHRNIISRADTAAGSFIIKDFHGMYFFNRLAYSLFRKSKARRSYENSERLNRMGITTPFPVAWIDEYKFGLLQKSFFIASLYPYNTLDEFMSDRLASDQRYKSSLFRDLAAFASKLHNLGVLHDDFSIGNIFVIQTKDGYDFALTDLNRMRFKKKITFKERLSNFKKIQLDEKDQEMLVSEYARLNGFSIVDSVSIYKQLRQRSSSLRRMRKKVRRYTIELIDQFRKTKPAATRAAHTSSDSETINSSPARPGSYHDVQKANQPVAAERLSATDPQPSDNRNKRTSSTIKREASPGHPAKSPAGESVVDNPPGAGGDTRVPRSND